MELAMIIIWEKNEYTGYAHKKSRSDLFGRKKKTARTLVVGGGGGGENHKSHERHY